MAWQHPTPTKLGERSFRVHYQGLFRHNTLIQLNDVGLEDGMTAELSLQPITDLRTDHVAAVRPFSAADITAVLAELGGGTDQR